MFNHWDRNSAVDGSGGIAPDAYLGVSGQHVDGAATFAALPTEDNEGGDLKVGDMTTLTSHDVGTGTPRQPQYPAGKYRYNGTIWALYLGQAVAPIDFVGTSGIVDGANGLVPAPTTSQQDYHLNSAGDWDSHQSTKRGTFIANKTAVLGDSGIYIMDCTGGMRTFSLPQATGSGSVYTVTFINVGGANKGRIQFPSGERINGADTTLTFSAETSVTFVDSAPNRFTTGTVLHVDSLTLSVPEHFPDIQTALDAAMMFTVRSSAIWINLANGQYDITSNWYSAHHNEIRIRGRNAQYFPQDYNGTIGTITGDKAADKATMMATGRTQLFINNGANGMSFNNCRNVSLSYLMVFDNRNGTPETTPANYLLKMDGSRMTLTFDRVLFFGSKYGATINQVSNKLYLVYCAFYHIVSRALMFDKCVSINTYRLQIAYCQFGAYHYWGTLAYHSRFQCNSESNPLWAAEPSYTRAIIGQYGVGVYLVYPRMRTKRESVLCYYNSTIMVGTTTSTSPVNTTILHGSVLFTADYGSVFIATGGATSNVDFSSISAIAAIARHNSTMNVSVFNSTSHGLPSTHRAEVKSGSIGEGLNASSPVTLYPAYDVDGTDFNKWL